MEKIKRKEMCFYCNPWRELDKDYAVCPFCGGDRHPPESLSQKPMTKEELKRIAEAHPFETKLDV